MKDFDSVMSGVGQHEDIQMLKKFIDTPEQKKQVVDFVIANKIECTHLWEDGEIGTKATKDWNKLVEYVLSIIKK